MTTMAHALSASYIAVIASGVQPQQQSLIITALVAASVIDLDHLYFLYKDKSIAKPGQLHKARSVFHELIGFFIISLAVVALRSYNLQLATVIGLAVMIRLVEDIIVGISIPFNPVDKTEANLLPQNRRLKILLDVSTIIIFTLLWIKYLNGTS